MIDAKSYLKQLRNIDRRIDRITEEIERLRARIAYPGINYGYQGKNVQGYRTDKMADYMVKLEALEQSRTEEMQKYTRQRKDVEDLLFQMCDINTDYSIILADRYLDGKQWIQIADALGLGKDTVIVYHGRAIRMLQGMIGQDNENEVKTNEGDV